MAHQRKHTMQSGGYCVCPKCNTKTAHVSGKPCIELRCPNCGSAMLREGSEHHKAALTKKKNKNDE